MGLKMNNQESNPMEELRLNVKYQLDDKPLKEISIVGYEFEKGVYVWMFLLPKELLNITGTKITECSGK